MLPSIPLSGDPPDPLLPFYPAVERYLALSRSTAKRLARSGDIPIVRFGRAVRVRESAIRDYARAAEARTTAEARP